MKERVKKVLPYAGMLVTAILITIAGILYHQAFLRILPLYISLVISYLQSKVSRTASLLGGLNSLLYAAVYAYYHLYASMAYAILISCPIQLLTFIRWKKNAYKGTTLFREMSWRSRGLVAGGFIAAWGILYAVLAAIGSSYAIWDNTLTLLGILISFLTMFAYIEYTTLMIPSALVNFILYALMIKENPEQTTYLFYSIYCFICQCIAHKNIRKVYKEQKAIGKAV